MAELRKAIGFFTEGLLSIGAQVMAFFNGVNMPCRDPCCLRYDTVTADANLLRNAVVLIRAFDHFCRWCGQHRCGTFRGSWRKSLVKSSHVVGQSVIESDLLFW